MRKLAFLAILAVPLLRSQYRELLRPEAIRLEAVVVGRDGKPIPGVRVDHHGNLRQTVLTDADGRFELQTKAPAIVLRKDGYHSLYAHVWGGAGQNCPRSSGVSGSAKGLSSALTMRVY